MLKVRDLSKTFTIHSLGGKRISGFKPLSFHVEKGRSLALSGPSGSGKSSILKCVYRSYLPSSGSVDYRSLELGAVDLATLPEREVVKLRRREIGYVTQFLRALPRVPAVDVVAEPLLLRAGACASDARRRAASLLRRLLIPEELLDASPATFSGGEQQRVNIARAIISCPELLLLDEPTASLDAASIEIVVEMLNELRRQGCTMLMVFHDPAVMNALSDKVFYAKAEEPANACA